MRFQRRYARWVLHRSDPPRGGSLEDISRNQSPAQGRDRTCLGRSWPVDVQRTAAPRAGTAPLASTLTLLCRGSAGGGKRGYRQEDVAANGWRKPDGRVSTSRLTPTVRQQLATSA